MTDVTAKPVNQGAGMVAGTIASVLAILGVFTIGTLFVPLAAIVAAFGTISAVRGKNVGGIGVSVLAWVLTIIGLLTSPVLLTIIGISAS